MVSYFRIDFDTVRLILNPNNPIDRILKLENNTDYIEKLLPRRIDCYFAVMRTIIWRGHRRRHENGTSEACYLER